MQRGSGKGGARMDQNKLESIEREIVELRKTYENLKSELASIASELRNSLAKKDHEINELRASIEQLKRNYSIEEAENENPEQEEPENEPGN